jgi:hypothetical protein
MAMMAVQTKIGLAGCLALAVCLSCKPDFAQSADHARNQSDQSARPTPAANVPQSQSQGNPFPGSTDNIPVLPSGPAANVPEGNYEPEPGPVAFPPQDQDPVQSPDQTRPDSASTQGFSSSDTGVDDILPPPTQPTGKDKNAIAPFPQATPKNDVDVGNYYLSLKNWRAALSRFQSAMVLEPDNPDVYWGLAECERHMGDFALAREHYLKVIEYDPGSKHSKEAKKALRDPEIANAKAAPAGAANATQQ